MKISKDELINSKLESEMKYAEWFLTNKCKAYWREDIKRNTPEEYKTYNLSFLDKSVIELFDIDLVKWSEIVTNRRDGIIVFNSNGDICFDFSYRDRSRDKYVNSKKESLREYSASYNVMSENFRISVFSVEKEKDLLDDLSYRGFHNSSLEMTDTSLIKKYDKIKIIKSESSERQFIEIGIPYKETTGAYEIAYRVCVNEFKEIEFATITINLYKNTSRNPHNYNRKDIQTRGEFLRTIGNYKFEINKQGSSGVFLSRKGNHYSFTKDIIPDVAMERIIKILSSEPSLKLFLNCDGFKLLKCTAGLENIIFDYEKIQEIENKIDESIKKIREGEFPLEGLTQRIDSYLETSLAKDKIVLTRSRIK